MNNLLGAKLGAAAMLSAGLALSPMAAIAQESDDPILIAYGDWPSAQINAQIMSAVLAEKGYDTEFVPVEYLAQISAVESSDINIAIEIWFTTAGDIFKASVAEGKATDYGATGLQAIEEWWYPLYVKELCPGLPDWKALNDCASLFSTAETGDKGRYVGGPNSWGGYDDERVEALGMDFVVVHTGNDATLNAEIKSAYERQAPFVAWVYAPNWTTAVFDGEFVEFPPYEAACYEDPAWGMNPDMAYDCGKPRGEIRKLGSNDLAEKWPGAASTIQNFTLTNDIIAELVRQVEVDGTSVDEVAETWLAENQETWSAW